MNDRLFCTYLLVDPRIKIGPPAPFYVGCGKGYRPYDHFEIGSCTFLSNRAKSVLIEKILASGFKAKDCIRYERCNLPREKAFVREKKLIAKYGKVYNGGILTNIKDGGFFKLPFQKDRAKWSKRRAKIYALFQSGTYISEIARKFCVSQSTISHIIKVEAANGTTRIRRPKPNGSPEGR